MLAARVLFASRTSSGAPTHRWKLSTSEVPKVTDPVPPLVSFGSVPVTSRLTVRLLIRSPKGSVVIIPNSLSQLASQTLKPCQARHSNRSPKADPGTGSPSYLDH